MNKQERCQQVLRYLTKLMPPPYPTVLRFEKLEGAFGGCDFVGAEDDDGRDEVVIFLDPRARIGEQYYWLLHEYAHAAIWSQSTVDTQPPHGPIFHAAFGILHDDFFEDGGCEKSRTI